MAPLLEIRDLSVDFEGKRVVSGLSLNIDRGQIHALTGPAGSGKSALAFALMGHPQYQIKRGRVLFDGMDFTFLPPQDRAKQGIFMAFQAPRTFPGVSVAAFLRAALKAARGAPARTADFRKALREKIVHLGLEPGFIDRELNVGFSEAEKKRVEILQLLFLSPKLAILDGGASGFDELSLRLLADIAGKDNAFLILARETSHFDGLKPNFVHPMSKGRL